MTITNDAKWLYKAFTQRYSYVSIEPQVAQEFLNQHKGILAEHTSLVLQSMYDYVLSQGLENEVEL